jgi:formylglycine-generating enzyme required for sulfatase activity
MTSNKLKLIAASIAISAAIALPAVADQPDHTLKLTIATGPSGIELIVNSVAASGAFLVYQSSTPQGLADHPSVVIQTNTPLTSGMRFSISTAQRPLQHAFYTAVHYTNMACIPAGTFTMGSPESEPARVPSEGPQTQVTISRGFLVGKHEVTQGKYLNLMGTNPSAFAGDLSLPVETVSWDDAVAYCVALTAKERNEGRLPAGFAYRLPTEAEWEYACRAGTTTAFHFGEAMRSGMANFNGLFEYPPCEGEIYSCYNPSGVYLGAPTKVENFAPNAWGLHDMHGNISEWCHDWFAENLPGGSVTDPLGPETGEIRIIKGGSWDENAWGCRSAFRFSIYPDARSNTIGFRVVIGAVHP